MPDWHVSLSVCGPISTASKITLNVEKGYHQPFWTTVNISRCNNGVRIEVTARADNQEDANEAGLFFVGQALDVLSLRINLPLISFLVDSQSEFKTIGAKRIVIQEEWDEAFSTGRNLGLDHPAFSRAISWYRKGLESNNPVDKFMAFWTSIESLAAVSARENERTSQGIINKICDCFDQLWQNIDNWKVIPNNAAQLNRLYEHRNTISHGAVAIQIDNLKQIAAQIPIVHQLAHRFLTDGERLFGR